MPKEMFSPYDVSDWFTELETGYEIQYLPAGEQYWEDWEGWGSGTTSPQVMMDGVAQCRVGHPGCEVRVIEMVTIRRLIEL